ncbi:MAG TPA: sulfite exporter TauE/SafE family protein [Candidatus Binatia bacterium]|jgi:uncharacterized membrane protein YfcA
MWESLAMFVVAFIISAFGTVVGFGGGVFMVPILTLIFQIPIQLAIGCVILALFPSATISTVHNFHRGTIDFVVGLLLEIPTVLGTILGAWLTSYLPTWQLELLFSFLVIASGVAMFRRNRTVSSSKFSLFHRLNNVRPKLIRHTANGTYQISGITVTAFGLISGIIAGLFGIGGGFIKGPLMVLGFGMPARVAAPTALFMIVITSAVGSISHYWLGHIQWEIGLFLVVAFTLGSVLGNQIAGKVSEKSLVKFIAMGLIAAGFAMVIFTASQLHR